MIFLSLHVQDHALVEPLALALSKIYSTEKVFYDGWALKPCEGILNKPGNILEKCEFLFVFISKRSLTNELLNLDWEMAVYNASKNQAHIVPVKLDDCLLPAAFSQTLYIDLFGSGMEYGLRQMVDVINKTQKLNWKDQTYENVRGYKLLAKSTDNELHFEVRAETYVEPISKYIILLQHNENELDVKCTNNALIRQTFVKDILAGENYLSNGMFFDLVRATSPGFSIKFVVKSKSGLPLRFNGIMRTVAENSIRHIPIIDE